MKTYIYLVTQTDRHCDATIIAYKDRGKAIEEAMRRATEAADFYHVAHPTRACVSAFPVMERLFYFGIVDIGGVRVEVKELVE